MDKSWILPGEAAPDHVKSLFETRWKSGTFLIWRLDGRSSVVQYKFSVIVGSSLVDFDLLMAPSCANGFVVVPDLPLLPLHEFISLMESVCKVNFWPLRISKEPVPQPQDVEMASGVVQIPLSSLKLGILVGKGSFGLVREGKLNNKRVALKQLSSGHGRVTSFTSEVNSLLALQHVRVVGLLGVVTTKQLHYIVLEYMEKGTLRHHLESNKKSLTDVELIRMALHVAEGMEFISQKNFVLRNLCSQNVLLNGELECKIADVALARLVTSHGAAAACDDLEIDYNFSFESVQKNLFTTKSDVWAFGILFMEVMSRGQSPYNGMNLALLRAHLETGNRWQRPACVRQEHYAIMQRCWKMKPRARPTFQQLVATLRKLSPNM